MENRKKTILITAIIVIIFLIIGAIVFWFLMQKENAPENPGTEFPGSGNIFPGSGNSTGNNTTGNNTTPGGKTGTGVVSGSGPGIGASLSFKPILRLVTNDPVSGGVTINRDKAYTRYQRRADGFTFETAAENILSVRLTNTTIAQVYSAAFTPKGDSAIIQYLKDDLIQTFSGNVIQQGAGQGEFRGQFLPTNITTLALSPSGTRVFFLTQDSQGGTGQIASLTGQNKATVFNDSLKEWIVSWPKEDTVAVNSKAGYNAIGLLKLFNIGKNTSNVVLSGIKGLTSLISPDAQSIIYSKSTDGGLQTHSYQIGANADATLALTTLPEKCVWSKINKVMVYCAVPEGIPSGNYPDDWYQGITTFRDEIWQINTVTGSTLYYINLSGQGKRDIDAINLSLDEKERFITFTNKNDLSLWTLQIAQ
jgi:hypothetical protein